MIKRQCGSTAFFIACFVHKQEHKPQGQLVRTECFILQPIYTAFPKATIKVAARNEWLQLLKYLQVGIDGQASLHYVRGS